MAQLYYGLIELITVSATYWGMRTSDHLLAVTDRGDPALDRHDLRAHAQALMQKGE
jgi:hypothetical protein